MMRDQSSDVMFFSRAENISASGIYFASRDLDRIFGPDVDDGKNLVELAQRVLSRMNTRVVVEVSFLAIGLALGFARVTTFRHRREHE